MRLDWLASWIGSWPKELPRLYPQLDDRLLSCFLSDAEYRSILKLPRVAVLPLVGHRSSPHDRAFGAGLARILTRDLALIETLSMHGPDHVPVVPADKVAEAYPQHNHGVIWLAGAAHVEEGLCQVDLSLYRPDRPAESLQVRGSMFKTFLTECSSAVAEALGANVSDLLRQMWTQGRPTNVMNLLNFGKLTSEDIAARQRSRLAAQLWHDDMDFSVVLQAVGDFEPKYRLMLMEGNRRDPYNVPLLCQLFSAVRETKGHEPYAVQFARRAIELSPGYGHAHCLMLEAAHPDANLYRHAELGRHLLPNQIDAICTFLAGSCRAGKTAKELTEIVREAINTNPYDPENYHRVIDTLMGVKQPRYALEIAKGLQQLFEPEMNPRTRQLLEQDPRHRHLLLNPDYDPVREVRALMRQLRESIAGK